LNARRHGNRAVAVLAVPDNMSTDLPLVAFFGDRISRDANPSKRGHCSEELFNHFKRGGRVGKVPAFRFGIPNPTFAAKDGIVGVAKRGADRDPVLSFCDDNLRFHGVVYVCVVCFWFGTDDSMIWSQPSLRLSFSPGCLVVALHLQGLRAGEGSHPRRLGHSEPCVGQHLCDGAPAFRNA